MELLLHHAKMNLVLLVKRKIYQKRKMSQPSHMNDPMNIDPVDHEDDYDNVPFHAQDDHEEQQSIIAVSDCRRRARYKRI